MRKLIPTFIVFSLMLLTLALNSFAVIFAGDSIYLLEKGKQIKDNSVIWKPANERSKRFKLCENGYCDYRQVSDPTEIIFFKTDNPDILTQREWWGLSSENHPDAKTYNKYLELQAQEAIYSKIITLPDVTDKNTYSAPKNGMTGGVIGSSRVFKIDIVSGKIKYLKRK